MVELHPNSNFNVKKKKDWQERKTLQTSFFYDYVAADVS